MYLVPFDIEIKEIIKSKILKFRNLVRYVDDIHLIFDLPKDISKSDIWKEFLNIEVSVNSWLHKNLYLSVNSAKSSRWIISNKIQRSKCIEQVVKSISGPNGGSQIIKRIKDKRIRHNLSIIDDVRNRLVTKKSNIINVPVFKSKEVSDHSRSLER